MKKLGLMLTSTLLATAAVPALAATAPLSTKEAVDIATDAYVYGYSLVTTDVTRIQMSNVAKAGMLQAPMNQFANVPRYPPGDYRGVSAPNADTLYSLPWGGLDQFALRRWRFVVHKPWQPHHPLRIANNPITFK